ncbi:MAG: thiamine phosphate synthase [Pseudomonadota bacterium]
MVKNPALAERQSFLRSLGTLATHARQVGEARVSKAGPWSSHGAPSYRLLVLSDAARLPGLASLIPHLPRNCAIVFRDYSDPERATVGRALRGLCARHAVGFFVAGDVALARRLGADGFHVPGWLLPHVGSWSGFSGLVTAACHGPGDLQRAARGGAHAALLSPIFPTQSHPRAPALGRQRFLAWAARSPLPVFALGGVTADNAAGLRAPTMAGLAVIGAVHMPLPLR